jgi:hypothetical protein
MLWNISNGSFEKVSPVYRCLGIVVFIFYFSFNLLMFSALELWAAATLEKSRGTSTWQPKG